MSNIVPPPLVFSSNRMDASSFGRQRNTTFTSNSAPEDPVHTCTVLSPEQGEQDHEERFYQDRIRPRTRSSSMLLEGPPHNITIQTNHSNKQLMQSTNQVKHEVFADSLDNLYPKEDIIKISLSSSSMYDDGKRPARDKESNKKDTSKTHYANKTFEISPGMRVPLRGAAETMDAVRIDFYTPCTCLICDDESDNNKNSLMFCIQDAEYVLCPVCKSVTPLSEHGFGVGLGFTLETLAEIQVQIHKERAGPLTPAHLAEHADDGVGYYY